MMLKYLTNFQEFIKRLVKINFLVFLVKWALITFVIGVLVGSASAFFLESLNWVTNYRENNLWIIWFLPIAGLLIGISYYYFGKDVERGNNQLLDEYYKPKKIIPFKMAPLVLIGTLLTHLFGGSAGREGTAVQMGGAISDQFTRFFKLESIDRKMLLIIGISAGFASVFGTPIAGAIFSLEVLILGRMRYEALIPAFLAAVVADYTCHAWNVAHTHYQVFEVPNMGMEQLFYTVFVGILFGLAALIFSKANHFWGSIFIKYISYPPLRPVIGGVVIAIVVYLMGSTRYIGLGVPIIEESFTQVQAGYDWIAKVIFTSFTLGAGFKGGEVTPLFYTGATLGSALSSFVPLPVSLLAAMGFVAVFSGATNTPVACIFMGIELFGGESALYIALACVVAYFFSGHSGIYSAQIIGSPKIKFYNFLKSRSISET